MFERPLSQALESALPSDVVRGNLATDALIGTFAPAIAAVLRADLRPELARLEAPLGFIWGERDRIVPFGRLAELRAPVSPWHGRADRLVPLGHSLKLAAAIPGCVARVDPTGGHFFCGRRLAEIVEPLAAARAVWPPRERVRERGELAA